MKITIQAYDTRWPEIFDREKQDLARALGPTAIAIEHIGSTAVPTLAAKPVIDILLEVSSLEALDAQTKAMEDLAYEAKGEFGIPGRRFFKKGGYHRTHHVHAFLSGDPNLHRHLCFRDYLCTHATVRTAYADLKLQLAERYPEDIDGYCDGKDAFVKEHEAKALEWQHAL